MDAYSPAQIAARVEEAGVQKARLDAASTLVLAVLAGAFIALGADFFLIVVTQSALGFGVTRLLGGVAFSLGLILVVVAGAELFTGNNLITMAWATGRVSTQNLLRNWALVYAGNFLGALATAGLVYGTGQGAMGHGAVGATVLEFANAKMQLPFTEALLRGVLCNGLVCLAVWLCMGARSVADKVLAIIFPISGFVACGFEHSVANMFLIPLALLIQETSLQGHAPMLGWNDFLLHNLLPVTLGNVLGGAGLVGTVYWFAYLRNKRSEP